MKAWHVIIIIIVILLLFVGFTYNSFIKKQLDVENSWAEIDNQLKRRYDLIPNLVETVKGYASHEKEVFTQVTEARASVGKAGTRQESIDANNQLTGALSRLLVTVESYPELKANQNFIRLQDELAGTESRIAVARRRYNETVTIYNKNISIFPNSLFAGMFNFDKEPLYKIDESEKETLQIKFD